MDTKRKRLDSGCGAGIAPRLFDAVSSVKLVDVAAAIELLNKFCVNETLGFKIGHRGIALFHQTLHVAKTF